MNFQYLPAAYIHQAEILKSVFIKEWGKNEK